MEGQRKTEGRGGRARSFRRWRRARPFVGGLLMALGGVEMFFSGQLTVGAMRVQVGIEGFQATLIPVVLVLVGVLATLMPQHRIFYGVIGLAVAVYSLVGVNLGGFFVGMILASVGGVLIVSWMPSRGPVADAGGTVGPDSAGPVRAGPDSAGPDSAGPDSAGPDSAGPDSAGPDSAGSDGRASAGPRRDGRRRRAAGGALAIALTIAAGVGLTAGRPQPAAAVTAAGTCILGFLGDCSTPSPTPTNTATPSPSAPGGSPSAPGGTGSAPGGTAAAPATPSGPTLVAPASAAPVFSGKPALLQGSSLSFSGLRYLGLATVRLSNGSTATVLKLSMDSVTIPGFRLDTRDATGAGTDTVATQMAFSGGVDTYCASLKGVLQNGAAVQYDIQHPPSSDGTVPVARILSLEVFGITGGSSVLTGFHEMIS